MTKHSTTMLVDASDLADHLIAKLAERQLLGHLDASADRPMPPVDGEAEVITIANAIAGVIDADLVAGLPPEVFGEAINAACWRHIRAVVEEHGTGSLCQIARHVEQHGEMSPAIATRLLDVAEMTPVTMPAELYVARIHRAAHLRSLFFALDRLRARVANETTSDLQIYEELRVIARPFRGA